MCRKCRFEICCCDYSNFTLETFTTCQIITADLLVFDACSCDQLRTSCVLQISKTQHVSRNYLSNESSKPQIYISCTTGFNYNEVWKVIWRRSTTIQCPMTIIFWKFYGKLCCFQELHTKRTKRLHKFDNEPFVINCKNLYHFWYSVSL